jgi:hypothetical protein
MKRIIIIAAIALTPVAANAGGNHDHKSSLFPHGILGNKGHQSSLFPHGILGNKGHRSSLFPHGILADGRDKRKHRSQQIMNHGLGGCTPNFSTGGCL